MKKIKPILHLVPTIDQPASGVDVFVKNLCDSLRSRLKIKLYTLKWTNDSNSKLYLRQFKLSKIYPKKLGFSSDLKNEIKKSVINNDFSIIHNHGLWMMPTIYSGLFKKKDNYKLVLSPHGAFSKKALSINKFFKLIFNMMLQKKTLKNVSFFHATSMAEYKDIRKLNYNQPVIVIPPGVKIPKIKSKKNNDRKTLIYLSRIHPIKGLETLITAWSRLEKKFTQWDLKIYGTGDKKYISKIKNYSLKLNNKRVFFNEAVYGDEKNFVLQNSDLFVLPTFSENFGIVVAEALANATPVIVSKGAPWDDLDSKGAGWWIDIGLNPLTKKLSESMKLSKLDLKIMGDKGRDWMRQEYSWDSISLKFLKTYNWINNNEPKPDWVKL